MKVLARLVRSNGKTVVVTLAVLVLFRILFPLAVLAQSPGRLLPRFPVYRYNPLEGDAYGYYYCARDLLATLQKDFFLVGVVSVAGIVAVVFAARFSRRPGGRTAVVVWSVGAIAAVLAAGVQFSGAAQVGWPAVWALALLPVRVVGASIRPDVAFGFGLALSLACNAASVVATYLLGREVGFRRRVALFGAGLFAFWPLLSLLSGSRAGQNGTWQIDLGLSLYTEPLSTALVLIALVRILRSSPSTSSSLLTGALLGVAVLVRLSNVLVVFCALGYLLMGRERNRAVAVAVGAAAFAPAAILFWPKSYPKLEPPVFPAHPFALDYARDAWSHSLLWHPAVLLVLVPLALVGIAGARLRQATLLWSSVAATAAFYTFYVLTPIHPRFLFVVLPIVLVFWAAGAMAVVRAAVSLYDRPR